MLATFHRTTLAAALALMLAGTAAAVHAGDSQSAVDMGLAPASQPVNVTLMLALRDEAGLERFIQQTVTPGSANFHKFLSTAEFARRHGATDAQLRRMQAYLARQGLRSTVLDNHITVRVSGTLEQFGKAFHVPIHSYRSLTTGKTFHRPSATLVMPSELGSVVATLGLNNQATYLSHRISTPRVAQKQTSLRALDVRGIRPGAAGNPTATGQPGIYTVGDVADFYNINPLYQRGVTGEGSTVAIVTLSDFDPADAETYWNAIGLVTKPHRIEQIRVDGGGAINGGSGETALDVEQAGGLAPFADVLVYDAPNTSASFVNAFAQAVSDNRADSISTSWGLPEAFNFAALNVDGAKPGDTRDAGDLQAFHEVFLEAAAQGQSVFAASGDSGAYDTVRSLGAGTGLGQFSAPLSVDSPASDPYITAAGGTTTPFTFSFSGRPPASITQESVWGWDYLQHYIDTEIGPGLVDLFSVGGGGGVSSYWRRPIYQFFTRGIRATEKNQALVYNDPTDGPVTYLTLPNHFHGRNVPDISLNADPETGYLVVATTDGGVVSGSGGTSFVAPQLNGITALLRQSSGHRVGLWNPQIYFLQNIFGYGRYSPFNSVNAGDNWYYHGAPHYTPGAGIGTLDVANLDAFLRFRW
ncbi:S53 family peptidase [Dyella sp.]|jgi:subtilase family serine protease|uniref:S53 family peptidase n=1 Tax=Dyella sp. TaxID=1869338 RepID=UPI002D776335|nr:S53 family peptidase [Dyella sp.]HET6434060.1 S53 family peptidase [Dyella sp.]